MLLEQHRQFLCSRAVAESVAVERGYQSASNRADLEKLGFGRTQQLIPALVLPIWSVRGAVESYQLRPDTPRLNQWGKPRKYEMKAGGRMLLDFHPRLTRRREGKKVPPIGDPTVPLLITEGIPKGDAAVSIGLCCCALLGVFNFRGTNEAGGKTALADWESVALNDRDAYIVFDSDVMEKREVQRALTRLKAFLESCKATVKLIYLPAGPHGEKLGLDDYIAREKAAGRSDAEVRDALLFLATSELLKLSAEGVGGTEIIIEPGRMPQMVDAAEKLLVANAARLRMFQRSGQAVRVVQLDRKADCRGLKRPEGTIQLTPVSPIYFTRLSNVLLAGFASTRRAER
jgi:Domain of unknown function (DUF3854)